MPPASIVAGVVGAATTIGSSVASGVQEGDQANQSQALMELNHKYSTIAEKRKMQRQKAGDAIASEQLNISTADKQKAQKAQDLATNRALGQQSQSSVLQNLNNNQALRERTLALLERKL